MDFLARQRFSSRVQEGQELGFRLNTALKRCNSMPKALILVGLQACGVLKKITKKFGLLPMRF
jgi:hypothetical protein